MRELLLRARVAIERGRERFGKPIVVWMHPDGTKTFADAPPKQIPLSLRAMALIKDKAVIAARDGADDVPRRRSRWMKSAYAADTKISLLGADTQPTGTEIVPLTQGGTTVRGTAKQLGDLGPYLNVYAYQAKGDNSTDDSTVIQAAINAAQTAGGGVVYFPRGDFVLTAAGLLISAGGVTLLGAGQRTSNLIVANNATIVPITISTASATYGDVNTYAQNAQVRDLTVDKRLADGSIGNIPNTASGGAFNGSHAIDIINFVFPKLINVEINNFGTGVYVTATYNTVFMNVFVVSRNASVANGYGFFVDGTYANASFYASYSFCVFSGFTGTTYGWYLQGPHMQDFFLDYCEGDVVNYGLLIDGNGGGSVDFVDVHITEFIADGCATLSMGIKNCTNSTFGGMIDINGGWTGGIEVYNSQGVIIRGVENSARGIQVDANSSDVTIAGCLVTGTISYPPQILYNGTYGSITGNICAFDSAGDSGIVIGSAAKEVAVTGNMVRGKGVTLAYGVYVTAGATGIVVTSNAIEAASVTTPVFMAPGAGNVAHSNSGNVATTTTPSVSSGTAFTPSTSATSMVYLTYAGTGTVTSVKMGPSTGTENTVYGSVAVATSGAASLKVPVGWKVVVTLSTTTCTALVVND